MVTYFLSIISKLKFTLSRKSSKIRFYNLVNSRHTKSPRLVHKCDNDESVCALSVF